MVYIVPPISTDPLAPSTVRTAFSATSYGVVLSDQNAAGDQTAALITQSACLIHPRPQSFPPGRCSDLGLRASGSSPRAGAGLQSLPWADRRGRRCLNSESRRKAAFSLLLVGGAVSPT